MKLSSGQGQHIAVVLEVSSGHPRPELLDRFAEVLAGHIGLDALPPGKTSDLTKWLVS